MFTLKRITLLFFLLSLFLASFSQSYYYLYSKGVTSDFSPYLTGTVVLNAPANDTLTGAVPIPFIWNFYGAPVSQLKISDNGYITFNTGTITSDPNNSAIPSAGGPNHAIYAMWDDYEVSDTPSFVQPDKISYRTVGTAPNRAFVIQWDVTNQGQPGNAYYKHFAIRLWEGGDFDILHQHTSIAAAWSSATVGCENSTGTDATMIAGSPNYYFTGGPFYLDSVEVYQFRYGTQALYDIELHQFSLPEVVSQAAGHDISGTIFNHGSQTINSLQVSYQAGAQAPVTTTLSGLNIPPNGIYTFTHPTTWLPATPGIYEDVTLWISQINGNPDANPANDTLDATTWVNLGIDAGKIVLVEEFTTAPCVYCPDGDYALDTVMANFPGKLAVAAHHSGYQSDSMTNTASTAYASLTLGAPMAAIDRFHYDGITSVAITRTLWQEKIAEKVNEPAPVEIQITHNYDAFTRNLDIQVDADFVDYAEPGDLRISVILVEDSVVGFGQGWDQTNAYNSTVGHPYYQAGNPIVGYVHRFVSRMAVSSVWGDAGIISGTPGPSDSYTTNYSLTLPANYDDTQMKTIAFVSYYGISAYDRRVLNANELKLTSTTTGAHSAGMKPALQLYPNPAQDRLNISLEHCNSGEMTFRITDLSGKLVSAEQFHADGNAIRSFNTAGIPAGIYLVTVADGDRVLLREKLVISR